ncbi:MAG: hydantoinase/oxoprolinase family protein [Actinomycetota bacterium]|nr:hydantoinase/oxoprolinase family protein [Actinomycetota bacterium]
MTARPPAIAPGDVRIGVDVGSTNTDAVAVAGTRVIASVKRPTTGEVGEGIVDALGALLERLPTHREAVAAVMVGTTQFVNALVQAKDLATTGVLRIGLPSTAALPPLVDWPPRLRRAIGDVVCLCRGGHEYDGSTIAPLDREAVRRAGEQMAERGVTSVAITSVFSPLNPEHELEAAALLQDVLHGVEVTLSSDIGRIGLLERENATIVNASLRRLAASTVAALERAIESVGLSAPLFVSQNDGTVMNADYARRFPVATFASGPTNSIRGAAFLSGLSDAAVIDVGGTTADVGMLVKGFPRPAPLVVEVAGVRTNFRMPDVLSLGIGGGSVVRGPWEELRTGRPRPASDGGAAAAEPEIGPDSVGYELARKALVFGGDTLTATDLAVALGRLDLGDRALVAHVPKDFVEAAWARIQSRLAGGLDRMRTSPEPVAVVAVGGGSALVEEELPGAAKVLRVDHGEVANAVGAAMAQIGAEVDRIVHVGSAGRRAAVEEVAADAARRAVESGAREESVQIVEVEEIPISYLPGDALRVRVKAVGSLAPLVPGEGRSREGRSR